jgi:hypothetical protein
MTIETLQQFDKHEFTVREDFSSVVELPKIDYRVVKQSAKQTARASVSLRAPEGEKSEFIGASGLFSISMGIDKILMQGMCLSDVIDIIDNTFGCCDIVVSDALQRFNFMSLYPGLSEDEALEMAIEIGDNWLKKSSQILANLTIPHKIFRWSDWLNSCNYQEKYNYVFKLFEDNEDFKSSVKVSTQKYLERKLKYNSYQYESVLSFQYQLENAYKFVLEESAIMLLWCDAGYDFELHPSQRSPALVHLHRLYYQNKDNKKLRQSRIKILGCYEDNLQTT